MSGEIGTHQTKLWTRASLCNLQDLIEAVDSPESHSIRKAYKPFQMYSKRKCFPINCPTLERDIYNNRRDLRGTTGPYMHSTRKEILALEAALI